MSKYLVYWELNDSNLPSDPKERATIGIKLDQMVKQEINEGKVNDWGVFIDGDSGYAVMEGNSADLYEDFYRYKPYINFEVNEVLSIDQALKTATSRMK